MKFSLKGLTRNKPALVVVGGAGILGLVALSRKRSSGGTAATGSTTSGQTLDTTGAGSYGGIGSYNSTSTDLASQLSAYGQSTQNSLADFGNQLTTALNGLQPTGAAPSGSGIGGTSNITPATPVTTMPVSAPAPVTSAPAPTPSTAAKLLTVAKGGNWNTVAAASGKSLAELRTLNGGVLPGLVAGQKVRIG